MAQQQKQPTAQELAALQQQKNQMFMALSYEQPVKMNNESGTTAFAQGRNLVFSSPVITGSYATGIVIKHTLKVNWTPGTTGTIAVNAGYPYNLVNNATVAFGNRQISVKPYIFGKVNPLIEGYARTYSDGVSGNKEQAIEDLLRKVPTTFSSGDNDVVFSTFIPLNSLHPSSINGILPIFSASTRINLTLNLPSAVAGADPIDNVFKVGGDGAVVVSGNVDATLIYRSYESMTTSAQAMQADLTGLPSVQVIQLPSITGLAAKVYNYSAFKNPYRFAKLFHVVIDGKQSDKFAAANNIIGYSMDKAENSNSSFFRYDETTGGNGLSDFYQRHREKFGSDAPQGIIVQDFTTDNIANVSAKLGAAYLNLDGSKGGYTASRFGFKLDTVGDAVSTGIAPRVETFGIILNDEGIKAL